MDDFARVAFADVLALRARVLRPEKPMDTAIWPCDAQPDTRHWAARRGGVVVAVATVAREPLPGDRSLTSAVGLSAHDQLRGMAVAPELQGTGVGRALLDVVLADVAAPVWCNARQRAIPFYQRAGFRIVSETFDIAGIGPHERMVYP